jgi:hypothetical protein
MEIDGEVYRKDVMILADGTVHHPWWRADGHIVTLTDVERALVGKLDIMVIGTGDPGIMKPGDGFVEAIEARGITLTILPTAEAVKAFNRAQGMACAGGFHLTC